MEGRGCLPLVKVARPHRPMHARTTRADSEVGSESARRPSLPKSSVGETAPAGHARSRGHVDKPHEPNLKLEVLLSYGVYLSCVERLYL